MSASIVRGSVQCTSAIRPVAMQARGMATEKQILMRINSTRNISKITKSMKMVSAAKLRGAETRLRVGRPFSQFLDTIFGKALAFEEEGAAVEKAGNSNLLIAITSDRGLCGGVNTFVSKAVRATIRDFTAAGKKVDLVILGEKGLAQLRRTNSKNIASNAVDLWKVPTNFAQASAFAEIGLNLGQYDRVHVLYNVFKSAVSQVPSTRRLQAPVAAKIGEDGAVETTSEGTEDSLLAQFAKYEVEPEADEVLQDLFEYSVAASVYSGMLESNTSEESSRMSAMENATKNAQEQVQSLTLVYNKARQARITTELIEIISGATSLEG